MKNSRRAFGRWSVASALTNDGAVKMKSSSSIFSSSCLKASKAKIENVDAAIRTLEPGVISDRRSSPSSSLTLSMILKSPVRSPSRSCNLVAALRAGAVVRRRSHLSSRSQARAEPFGLTGTRRRRSPYGRNPARGGVAMNATELFEKVTDDLVAAIEEGASGWRMPWQRFAAGLPVSVDDRPYRGLERVGPRLVRGRAGLVLGPVGHVSGVAASRLPGPPRRTRHTRRVVEAEQPSRQRRRRQRRPEPSDVLRSSVHGLRSRTGRRRRALHAEPRTNRRGPPGRRC